MEAAVVTRRRLAREIVGALYKDFDGKPSEQDMRGSNSKGLSSCCVELCKSEGEITRIRLGAVAVLLAKGGLGQGSRDVFHDGCVV